MTERTTMSKAEQCEAITWAICAAADGAGPGKCDPFYCVCGHEGVSVVAALHHAGFDIVRRDDPSPST